MGFFAKRRPAAPWPPADGDEQAVAGEAAGAGELGEFAAGLRHWELPEPRTAAGRRARRRSRERERERLGAVRRSLATARRAARGPTAVGRLLTDRLLAAAPRIPIRDLATLRAQHPQVSDPEELADLLVKGACRAAAGVGAGIGAAAMVPTPPAITIEIATETLAVAAVEIKLIAELHEVYGQPAPGNPVQRATAYVGAWANRRGIDSVSLLRPSGLLTLGVGAGLREQVRKRLARSTVRRLPTLTPFLIGSALGASLNRRDTQRLAHEIRADLRGRPPVDPAAWARARQPVRPAEG
ncbi:hypothetical protein ACIGXM_27775 [Kitasatospora sp. NPDC052896]|uniref:hypothetical protein n=1 Tax=Kitasatospora sp. NPDC052896 TaxID=3364061 RepID=UPI0037CC3374